MKRCILAVLAACVASVAFAQSSSVAVETGPMMTAPLGAWSAAATSPSGGGMAGIGYGFGGTAEPFLRADLFYVYSPIEQVTALSSFGGHADLGLRYHLRPRLAIDAFAGPGYVYGMLADGSASEGLLSIRGGLGISFMASKLLDLGVRVSYRADLGLAHLIDVRLGARFHLSGTDERQRIIEASRASDELLLPPPDRGLRIQNLSLSELFPVFYTYYDSHRLGTLDLVNLESKPITHAKLSFFVPQFMETPREAMVPETIAAGDRVEVELSALFTDEILSVTEATKVAGELSIEYTMDDKRYGESTSVTVRLFDRNATIWDDDRRAAAFVTAKDPTILSLSKNAAGTVRGQAPDAIDRNMVVAMGLFSVLDLLGVNYVIDPQTPYAEFSESATAIDYLQFPRQTLEYRAGDCDDLSVLYAAMLESVGIETAFVTVPGHIFLAFKAEQTPTDLSRTLSVDSNFISDRGTAWFPVEVTVRGSGFMEAWLTAVREWHDASASGTARLFPVHEAWSLYEPVALPGSLAVAAPSSGALIASVQRELSLYIERELGPQVQQLTAQLESSGESPRLLNALGIVYARYGQIPEAVEQFERATSRSSYAPALINLGNVSSLAMDWTAAAGYYEQAAQLRPNDSAALLGLGKAYFGLGEYESAREVYAQLEETNPSVAEQFAYLGGVGDTTARAAAADEAARIVIWAEEE